MISLIPPPGMLKCRVVICLLDDDAPNHSGEYFSHNSILYPNPENRPGGWPMESPNPLAHDKELAEKLYRVSLEIVWL